MTHPNDDQTPLYALRRKSAAAALDVSVEYFDKYVRPEIPVIRRGRIELYPLAGLDRWLDDNADGALAA
jgi:hypothetical protein